MDQKYLDAIIDELRPRQCLRDIGTYWGFRSTVPGSGLRQASEFLVRRHREHGVPVELVSYPADDRSESFDGHKNPLAWTPRAARLEIVEPQQYAGLICSYAEEPLSLLSNSMPTPPEGITAPVVIVSPGTRPEDYEGIDVAGKIVFVDAWPLNADAQVRQHQGVGLITDSVTPPWLFSYPPVRQRADVPDLTMWGILNGHRCERPLWGFSLTPRQGARLRQIIAESKTPVILRAVVDAELAEGTSELVNAVLPGSDLAQEEVWVLSHSSEPGALDDASGCCLQVEIARALKALLERGALPPLRRTIRFLNAVETEGYYFYVTQRRSDWPRVVAALALDAVGQDFRKSGGTRRLNRSPEYNPSFADGLLEALLTAVAAKPAERFTADNYELCPWQADPCFPGNDNFLADGYFDIPTPMLDDWPDKFYHSNQDTVDKLSPGSIGRGAAVAAAYLYLLATAGREEALWLAWLTLQDYRRRILADPARAYPLALEGRDALRTVLRVDAGIGQTLEAMSAELWAFGRQIRESQRRWAASPEEKPAAWPEQPVRAGEGPLLRPNHWRLPAAEKFSAAGQETLAALRKQCAEIDRAWEFLNGRRSALEIIERCVPRGLPGEAVREFLELLAAEGFITQLD